MFVYSTVDTNLLTILTTATTESWKQLENNSRNTTFEIVGSCDLNLVKGEFPMILITTLAVNLVALAVLIRMRGTCDSLDHCLVSLLNANDLITTGLYTLIWTTGWASCNQIFQIPAYCAVCGWLTSALLVWSAAIILIISSFRYLSLSKPLYYRAHVNSRTVAKTAAGTLIFSLMLFILPFTGVTEPFVISKSYHLCIVQFASDAGGVVQRVFTWSLSVLGCATVAYVVVCNLAIAITLRQRYIARSQASTISAGPYLQSAVGKRKVVGHVTLAMSFVFVVCYAPFVIRLFADSICNTGSNDYNIGRDVSSILLFFSPLLNPIVYGVFNKHFRVALRTLLKRVFRRERNKVQPGVVVMNT